jgi:hypothetical protein
VPDYYDEDSQRYARQFVESLGKADAPHSAA